MVHGLGWKNESFYIVTDDPVYKRGKFDDTLIVSRGIARYLPQCADFEEVVSIVPPQIWDAFPGLLPFVQEYNKKFMEIERDKSKTERQKEVAQSKLEEEIALDSMLTDFTAALTQEKS